MILLLARVLVIGLCISVCVIRRVWRVRPGLVKAVGTLLGIRRRLLCGIEVIVVRMRCIVVARRRHWLRRVSIARWRRI